ncbi:secretory lipase-domain-containing protein [Aspergillus karnatakaensis]|uniref:secretory lipase-domain-containing protein n=1 Tax=Aspergillus karnatakaensis TaxID=1810916 RepID=UPI003CCCF6A6
MALSTCTSLWTITVLLIHFLLVAANPLPPTIDPFYKPQNDSWKSEKPGYIIDRRPVTLPSLIPGTESPLTAHQLLFVTRNATGDLTTSVTTVIRPQYANPDRLLSYQIAYDSADGTEVNAGRWNQLQLTLILPFLMSSAGPAGKRPFINIPDYEGNNAAFTVGPQSGYHTLDSIRAALNSQNHTNINPDAMAIMFGYSGGGLASEWAAELHAKHDSDLNIIAAAISGPPPNVTNTYIHVNGTRSPLNVWAILGVMNAFPEVNKFLTDNVKLKWGSYFLGPQTRCSSPDPKPPTIPSNANVTDWYENGDEFLKTNRPRFPLYIYQGTEDNITAPISDTDELYRKYCQAGTKVWYLRYVGQDHGQTLIAGMYRAWSWISARFAGVPVLECSVRNVIKDGDGDGDEDDFASVYLGDDTGLEEQSGQQTLSSSGFAYGYGDDL